MGLMDSAGVNAVNTLDTVTIPEIDKYLADELVNVEAMLTRVITLALTKVDVILQDKINQLKLLKATVNVEVS